MADLDDRLRGADHASMPDLWTIARQRAEEGERWAPPRHSARARILTAAAALAIAAAAVGALVWTFRGTHHRVQPLGPQPNGAVVTVESGPAGSGLGVDNTDIVAIDPATGQTVNLTNSPDAESDPVWSPDGKRAAFLRTTSQDTGRTISLTESVFVMNSDGSGLREMRNCTEIPCEIRQMAWSPDDTHLALVSDPGNTGGRTLLVLDVRSGSTVAICAGTTCGEGVGELAWSPDGSRIAFSDGDIVLPGPGGPVPGSIWVAQADGSATKRLTEGHACIATHDACFNDGNPAWSPDGATLAFSRLPSDLRDETGDRLVLMGPNGDDVREFDVCSGQQYCSVSPPRWSPDGASIVFTTGVEPETLRLFDVATDRVTELPTTGNNACANPYSPFWSPDGKLITFDAGPGRADNLCAVPKEGGTPNVVVPDVHGPRYSRVPTYTWLPAGAIEFPAGTPGPGPSETPPIPLGQIPEGRIVFVSTNGGEEEPRQLWTMSARTPAPQPLTAPEELIGAPAMSPDGTQIAADRKEQVWVMDTDGSNARGLTDYRWGAYGPAWSPDGSRIAFAVEEGKGVTGGVYVMAADGTGQRLVAPGNVFGLSWTRNGSAITFSLNTPDGQEHLRNVDLATGTVRPISDLPGSQDGSAWSPDGSLLAFGWASPSGSSGIYVMAPDGSSLRRVVGPLYESGTPPAWSPDGQWLAFEGVDNAHGPQLYVIHPDGTGLTRITDMPGFLPGTAIFATNGEPSWGPGG